MLTIANQDGQPTFWINVRKRQYRIYKQNTRGAATKNLRQVQISVTSTSSSSFLKILWIQQLEKEVTWDFTFAPQVHLLRRRSSAGDCQHFLFCLFYCKKHKLPPFWMKLTVPFTHTRFLWVQSVREPWWSCYTAPIVVAWPLLNRAPATAQTSWRAAWPIRLTWTLSGRTL